jgi:uncharacterized phiE125 gp8 family phage protein
MVMAASSHSKPAVAFEDPIEEPLTLAECRAQCRLVPDNEGTSLEAHPDDDALLAYLAAARDYAERFTGLAIAWRTYTLKLTGFPANDCPIDLGIGPVGVITSITYLVSGTPTVLDASNYELDDAAPTGVVHLVPDAQWPEVDENVNSVVVTFKAGYRPTSPGSGDPTMPVLPHTLKSALKLMLAHWYENREAVVLGTIATQLPLGIEALLRQHRVRYGMA